MKDGQQKLQAIGPEHDRYRQLQQALEESKSMINDTNNRLLNAREELEELFEGGDYGVCLFGCLTFCM